MSELIVIGYDTPSDAEEARDALLRMASEYMVEVADAVVATSDENGGVKLNQLVNLWTAGAAGGSFWGLLVGLLFLNPLLGVLVGGSAGALSGALTDFGINDAFMKNVSETLKPGTAALFLMTKQTASDKVLDRLASHGGEVIRTNLDTAHEARVREAFAAAHAEAVRHHGDTVA